MKFFLKNLKPMVSWLVGTLKTAILPKLLGTLKFIDQVLKGKKVFTFLDLLNLLANSLFIFTGYFPKLIYKHVIKPLFTWLYSSIHH